MTKISCDISNIDIGLPEYWTYKGEGAMNIVLSYNGPQNDKLDGLVLRVKKLSNGGSNLEKEIELYNFVSKVMSPLLGDKYVFPGIMINVTSDFLEKLDYLIFNHRPTKRSVIRLDTNLTTAFLIVDLTRLDNTPTQIQRLHNKNNNNNNNNNNKFSKVICIEIKPKWAFLPKSHKYMNKELLDMKLNKCRYCMHQELKLKEGSINEISSYCPLDLFSGDFERQKQSIVNMIHHPQNNLKVYCDGVLSFTGSLGGGMERNKSTNSNLLSSLLINSNIVEGGYDNIYNNSNKDQQEENGEKNIHLLSSIISSILQRETILENIKNAQLYDEMDIEGIYYLYSKLNGGEVNSNSSGDYEELNKLTDEEAKEKIDRFMISCTAKDCSIMISFNVDIPISNNNNNNINIDTIKDHFNFINTIDIDDNDDTIIIGNSNKTTIHYKIGVVDLDTKKMNAIPKYYKLDQDIVRLYKSNVNNIKLCK
ncbi:hypothetical protein RB653_008626 [Dictyostelium firmibasis]|uniref:Inositol-pentakisphosphate 2-kinase n=1 Tax=Dictyostelium firmibasis TaxID=79012 RepID=A0AAN7U0F1_9MYCE